jgi:uncharacterized membrane protein
VTQANSFARFLRTTAIGGAIFLLPLIVVAALVGQVVPIVLSIAEGLGTVLPDAVKTVGGITLLVLMAVGILLLLCFAAGVLARVSLSRRISDAFERKLLLLFPRYAIIKDQMADSIGGEHTRPQLKPVLVQCEGMKRIAFETERSDDLRIVTVYLPGSPDPWAGNVAVFPSDQVEPLHAAFGEAVAVCEQLGRGTAKLLSKPSNN